MRLDPECTVLPGFELVATEFERNFDLRGDLGACFAAMVDGELVVDLWGGIADRRAGAEWGADTLVVIFSGTKGLVAICLLLLLERGLLELDRPIAEYWPEFAAAGKEAITVRQAVTHSDSLPGLTGAASYEEIADDRLMAERIASQAPLAGERAARCYHPLSYGWICGELVRRVDGRSIGTFFRDEFAEPLGLDIFIGLPAELEPRVAVLELAESWPTMPIFAPDSDDPLTRVAYGNPPLFPASPDFPWNRRDFHAAEIAGANGIASARSMATLYGRLDELLEPATLALGRTELERRFDGLAAFGQAVESVFGVGFALQDEILSLGPPADGFGHGGAGGSVHGCWPSRRTGFSYAMNQMRDDDPDGDPRPGTLLQALAACVDRRPAVS